MYLFKGVICASNGVQNTPYATVHTTEKLGSVRDIRSMADQSFIPEQASSTDGQKKSTISYKNVLVGTQKTDYLKSALDVNVQYHTTRETADYRRSLSRRQLGLSVLIRHKKLPQENRICR